MIIEVEGLATELVTPTAIVRTHVQHHAGGRWIRAEAALEGGDQSARTSVHRFFVDSQARSAIVDGNRRRRSGGRERSECHEEHGTSA